MSLFFSNMLLGQISTEVPKGKGRIVSFAGTDPDIRLTTGSMSERVLGYLYLSGVPCRGARYCGRDQKQFKPGQ